MCLELKTSRLEVKIAKNTIVCYKHGIVSKGVYESPCQYYKYKNGVLQPKVKLDIRKSDYKDNAWVNDGYHSYINFFDKGDQVFLIPKGAEYIEGGDNEIVEKHDVYVSDQIVWIGNKWNPITWLKVLFYK